MKNIFEGEYILFLLYYFYTLMKLIRTLLIISILSLFVGTSFAAFSYDDYVTQFQTASNNFSLTEKKAYYLKVYNNFSLLAFRNRSDTELFTLYTSLKSYVQTQIKAL